MIVEEVKSIDYDPAPNSIGTVDQIKKAYEAGAFNTIKPGRANRIYIDICGLDRDRLVAYFDKQKEFNHEQHHETFGNTTIDCDEFISNTFDIEIHENMFVVYKISESNNESISKK